jgi:hypothetical protein
MWWLTYRRAGLSLQPRFRPPHRRAIDHSKSPRVIFKFKASKKATGKSRHTIPEPKFVTSVISPGLLFTAKTSVPPSPPCEEQGALARAEDSGILNNELQAQRARRRLHVRDDGWGSRNCRVRENAERGSIG